MLLFDLLYLLLILVSIPIWIKFFLKREYKILLKHRISPDIKPTDKKRIWIHAVSVGEVKSIKNLIEKLIEKSNREIVLSVTTPAGYEFAKNDCANIKVINSPLDFSFVIKRFIKKINPELLILNELEIWPNWTLITKKFNIPILLINGRISDNAFKKYRIFLFFLKQFFNKIDLFLVQAEIFKKRFSQLRIAKNKIKVCGNIKADEAFNALNHLPTDGDILNFLKIEQNGKRIITLASSHPSDEKIVIPGIKKLQSNFSFIITPRHLSRIEEIKKMLNNNHIKYAIWSQSNRINLDDEVLIFDKIGYLFNILKISDIVVMGGTFEKKIGGHNLYEPAVLGKLIVGGPHYNNFPDIGKELVENGTYKQIDHSGEFLEFFENIDGTNFNGIKSQAFQSILKRKGSIECILKEVQNLIKF